MCWVVCLCFDRDCSSCGSPRCSISAEAAGSRLRYRPAGMARVASCSVVAAAGTASGNAAADARSRCRKTIWNLLGVKLG